MTRTRPAVRILQAIRESVVLPVLREPDQESLVAYATELLTTLFDVAELTTTTPGWQGALTQLRRDHPDAVLGMGTVLDEQAAREALDLGADFLVTPCRVPTLDTVVPADVLLIQGGMTPSEIAPSRARGVAKVFPAHLVGPSYLGTLRAVFPGLTFIPTGGVCLRQAPAWLDAGAAAVGIGGGLRSDLTDPEGAALLRTLRSEVAP
ncbi:bifunctional 4-hydroxy-2-oxoglutarate aldolase/2-dehydro-3-deoxy-phosphogluconate aldolase [Streptomyces sp. NPDC058741]|uniref:bifunctional 4-hydroxy-2-oxoglutarate aldolase/2-dehydro-3-deoxy-phosphogluconate aldolase n=1 Tax=unclassified Streptomyces TaxID=2593676 RepID=UPI00369C201F